MAARRPREMTLTPEIVALVPPYTGDPDPLSSRSDRPTDEDYETAVATVLAGRPPSDEVWVFAYGSLIWNPGFAIVEERLGTVQGWHRSFCLGWVQIYRGTPERPGLMLALDRGGSCRGVVFRLATDTVAQDLEVLLRREMPLKRPGPPARWVGVQTGAGPVRAIAFPVSRKSPFYLQGLAEDTVVDALASAAGVRGSMADYLYSTVRHLEDRGIHDRYLWNLQHRVALRVEAFARGR